MDSFGAFVVVSSVACVVLGIVGSILRAMRSRGWKEIAATVVQVRLTAPYGSITARWIDPLTRQTYQWSATCMFTLLQRYRVGSQIRVKCDPKDPRRGRILV